MSEIFNLGNIDYNLRSKTGLKQAEAYLQIVDWGIGGGRVAGADPDYIRLCKCWSYIFSGKIIKKYRNTHFLHQIVVFFSSADRKD